MRRQLALVLFCFVLAHSQKAEGFDFADVQAIANGRAARPYRPPENPVPAALTEMTYEAYQKIAFKSSHALWLSNDLPFRIEFLHRGHFHLNAVGLNEI